MAYWLRAEDRALEPARRTQDDGSALPPPVPGKRTLTERLPAVDHGPRVIQAKASPGVLDDAPRPSLGALFGHPGSGQQLPAPARAKMERSLGADFSAVRVHEGPQAAAIGARAFARGNDLYFAPGQYDPSSEPGQRLLGHELAHVVQQRAGVARGGQGKGLEVNVDPSLEAEADRAGEQAARGDKAQISSAGSGAAGDTIQGEFFEDILFLLLVYYAFKIVGVARDEYHRADRARIAHEEEQARLLKELAALQQARSEAHQLAVAAEQAAAIVERARSETGTVQDPGGTARDAAERARDSDRAACAAEDSETAQEHAADAKQAAAGAIAVAVAAVAAAARSYARRAADHHRAADEQRDDTGRSAQAASDAADETAQAAERAAHLAQQAESQATAGDVTAATAALNDALEAAQQAGKCARKADKHARTASEHAASAERSAQGAAHEGTSASRSPSAQELDGASEIARHAPDELASAQREVDGAREDTGKHASAAQHSADGASERAEDASRSATGARERADDAERDVSGARNHVIAQVHVAIAQHRDAAVSTNKTIPKITKRHAHVSTLAEHMSVAKQQLTTIAELDQRVDAAKLEELSGLVSDAMAARNKADQAVMAIRADCAQDDARVAAGKAEELANQLAMQVREVETTVGAAQKAMVVAKQAVSKARAAMAEARELASRARSELQQISIDEPGAIKRAEIAEQQLAEVTRMIAEAQDLYKLAAEQAEAAEATANRVPEQAANRKQTEGIEKLKATATKAAKTTSVNPEQQRIAASERDAKLSEDKLSDGRKAGHTASWGAREQLDAIERERKDANQLENQGRREVADRIAKLVASAGKLIERVNDDVDEIINDARIVGIQLDRAQRQIAGIDKRAEPSTLVPDRVENKVAPDTTGHSAEASPGENQLAEEPKPSAGHQALSDGRRLHDEMSALARQLSAERDQLPGTLDPIRRLTALSQATSAVAELKADIDKIAETISRARACNRDAKRAFSRVDEYDRANHQSLPLEFTGPNLEGFATADKTWVLGDKDKARYGEAYNLLATSSRVFDPGNLAARKEPPTDSNKFHSNFMELQYLARALSDEPTTHAQVGSMTFSALKNALTKAGFDDHAAKFDAAQGEQDRKLFGLELKALCYEADGVIWRRNSVEVVQHKRTTSTEPTERGSDGRNTPPFEEQLRGAANQLGGWTAEGGRSAQGGQPEYPPPGKNRRRVINVDLPFAARPADLAPYEKAIASVMQDSAGNGQGAPFYTFVECIQIHWGFGHSRSSAKFAHRGGGTYDQT